MFKRLALICAMGAAFTECSPNRAYLEDIKRGDKPVFELKEGPIHGWMYDKNEDGKVDKLLVVTAFPKHFPYKEVIKGVSKARLEIEDSNYNGIFERLTLDINYDTGSYNRKFKELFGVVGKLERVTCTLENEEDSFLFEKATLAIFTETTNSPAVYSFSDPGMFGYFESITPKLNTPRRLLEDYEDHIFRHLNDIRQTLQLYDANHQDKEQFKATCKRLKFMIGCTPLSYD